MIISKTPLRISFFGGGTDFENFYKDHGGYIISATINKYIYISLIKKFDKTIRVSYSLNENPNRISQIQNPLIKETLKHFNLNESFELTSTGDIPASNGLGSSSAYVVGLCNLLSHSKNKKMNKYNLANLASRIEINKCHSKIGVQDHYAAAFGGLNYIKLRKQIIVKKLNINKNILKELNDNLILIYTNKSHNSYEILKSQFKKNKTIEKIELLKKMNNITKEALAFLEKGNLNDFSNLLLESWRIKKEINPKTTNILIDNMYNKCIDLGAKSGKILGAGDGGFLMVYADKKVQKKIKENFKKHKILDFQFTKSGSEVFTI